MTQYPSYLLEPEPVAPVAPAPPPLPAPAAPPGPGWFRSNRWGLVAVIPVTIAMIIVYFDRSNAYEKYWEFQPREPVAAVNGWAEFADAKIRLVEFGPAKDLLDSAGKPYKPAQGLTAWRAVLEFNVADQTTIMGCTIGLEDKRGRLYSARPDELNGARIKTFPGCTDLDDEKLDRYQTVAYFVTPTFTSPVAVRVNRGSNLPRYARLTVTG